MTLTNCIFNPFFDFICDTTWIGWSWIILCGVAILGAIIMGNFGEEKKK